MLSIIAAGYLVNCDFHAWGVAFDIFAAGLPIQLRRIGKFCWCWMCGFWKDQDGDPNVEFCFFSLGEGSFKSRMPIWLSRLRIFE